jgi:NADH-quinone oxidoreductase subunit F
MKQIKKISSREDFEDLIKACAHRLDARKTGIKANKGKTVIALCNTGACRTMGSLDLLTAFQNAVKAHKAEDKIEIQVNGCFGFCQKGPIVKIYPDDIFYIEVKPADAERIVINCLQGGKPLEDLLFADPATGKRISKQDEIPFYKKQVKIALRNCGVVNPESIEDYICCKGYQALERVLFDWTPEQVIDGLKVAGLRGRGGAGFPTWMKWNICRGVQGDKKYTICNADEGDPGAFMDRSIMESDPFSIIEAMAIAGHTIGADEGVIYVRAEYPLACEMLQKAIDSAEEYGFLGKNIMGSGFNYDISIRFGAGAFVCGEETALIKSVEGERGEPVVKPPFPAQQGLFKKPTIVNNVETYANIPYIFTEGPENFAKVGTVKSHGTKVFALAGKINNVGLVEVPMGTSLREIIYDIGGGIKNGKKLKAVQTGGPSGGCIPASLVDTPIDYDNLTAIGSMMGSGGMIVMDEDNCMVNIAKFYLTFTCDESCGKCTPCRVGNKRLLEILEKITNGDGTLEDLDKLEHLGRVIEDTALCGLGQTSPNPVLSTLRYFKDEYIAHVTEKLCPSHECKALSRYTIDSSKCIGCGNCARKCPVNAISKTDQPAKNPKLFIHHIDEHICIRCGTCEANCPVKAISL